jgi:hypothetical protein
MLLRTSKIKNYSCQDNTKMDLKETGWEGVDWTRLAQEWGPVSMVNPWVL